MYLQKYYILPALFFVLTLSLLLPAHAFAATTPSLETAGSYTILADSYTRNSGVTTIMGSLGYATLSGVGSHTVSGVNFVVPPTQSRIDQTSALSLLDGQLCDYNFTSATDLSLLAQPLRPGVYCIAANTTVGSRGITLSGKGTYIFRIKGFLTVNDNAQVTLADGASSCDMFWTPTSTTIIGSNATFHGTVIDDSGIVVGTNTHWNGRALAYSGSVTTMSSTIDPTCISAPTTTISTVTVNSTGGASPSISVKNIPSPSMLSTSSGWVTYTKVVTNTGTVPLSNVRISDDRCALIDYVYGDLNRNSMLDTSEVWVYGCETNITSNTTNTVFASGDANGMTASDVSSATVTVGAVVPGLPDTGIAPMSTSASWNIVTLFRYMLSVFL